MMVACVVRWGATAESGRPERRTGVSWETLGDGDKLWAALGDGDTQWPAGPGGGTKTHTGHEGEQEALPGWKW